MIVERRQLILVGAAATMFVLFLAGVIASMSGSSRHQTSLTTVPATAAPTTLSAQSSGFTAVPPATDVPTDTPVQQQYDQALSSGLSASASLQSAEITPVPAPAYSKPWPSLAVATTPEQWVREFTTALLDIDFATQSRSGLGSWLTAEEAPELLPGVSASVADKVLYLSLADATAVGGSPSPIPDATTWQSDALATARWHVSNVLVQPDPRFSQIVAAGWQPIDQRFAVDDVSGVLTSTHGNATANHRFSMTVYVGSAHWHAGYGTVLVDNWQES